MYYFNFLTNKKSIACILQEYVAIQNIKYIDVEFDDEFYLDNKPLGMLLLTLQVNVYLSLSIDVGFFALN